MKRAFVTIVVLIAFTAASHGADARLDYKQKKLLQDAESYLDEADSIAKELATKIKDWKPGDTSIQIGTVDNYIGGKDRAIQRIGYANNRFKELPATNADVKTQLDRVKPLTDSLTASEKKLNEVHASLKNVVAQGSGAGYKADF